MVGSGRCIPLHLSLFALITMFLTPTSQFGFRMMRAKFCQSCFKITASTAIAQFGHFTLKTKDQFQKEGGVDPPWRRHCLHVLRVDPPWRRHCLHVLRADPPGCATVFTSSDVWFSTEKLVKS